MYEQNIPPFYTPLQIVNVTLVEPLYSALQQSAHLCKIACAHLLDNIETVFIKNNVPTNNRFIDMQVLLGQPAHLTQLTIAQLQALVANFVQATGAII